MLIRKPFSSSFQLNNNDKREKNILKPLIAHELGLNIHRMACLTHCPDHLTHHDVRDNKAR